MRHCNLQEWKDETSFGDENQLLHEFLFVWLDKVHDFSGGWHNLFVMVQDPFSSLNFCCAVQYNPVKFGNFIYLVVGNVLMVTRRLKSICRMLLVL